MTFPVLSGLQYEQQPSLPVSTGRWDALIDALPGFAQSAAATGIEATVCADIAKRQQRGIEKYGVTLVENPLPLRDWVNHLYEELLDAAVYAKRAMAILPEPEPADSIAPESGPKVGPGTALPCVNRVTGESYWHHRWSKVAGTCLVCGEFKY